jgi:hypothetical protein
MVNYDPQILQTFAERLYARARSIAFAWTLLLAIIGLAGGIVLGAATENLVALLIFSIFFSVVGGAAGYLIGSARAFTLKLQAQVALCQVCIEQNTRTTAHNTMPGLASPPQLPR